jgi:hypothetical protein
MSLLNRPVGKALSKPQNQISDAVKNKVVKEFSEWFEVASGGAVSSYTSRLLAVDLVEKVISDRIKATSPTAADVYFNDAQKVSQLVAKMQEMAGKLDSEEKLEPLLDDLYNAQENEANS